MGRFRKLLLPTIAAAIGLIILLNLGFWQVRRLAEKEALIDQVEVGLTAASVAAPAPESWPDLTEADDYRRVTVTGKFRPDHTFYYISLSDPAGDYGGPGKMIYSPFETDAGWTVLVNRGFLPDGLPQDQLSAALQPPAGDQDVTGLLRFSEMPVWTTPAPDPKARLWFARDTDAMARFMDIDVANLAPFSIDAEAEFTPASGFPQAGETLVRFKNDHLGYALTWFGLAATLAGVFLAYAATLVWPRKPDAGTKDG